MRNGGGRHAAKRVIAEWKQFGRPSGVAPNPGWLRGIRVGELATGKVLYRIPDPLELKGTSAAEGLTVDAMRNVYGGEVGPRQLAKHLWTAPSVATR